jgi:hypothetical protein
LRSASCPRKAGLSTRGRRDTRAITRAGPANHGHRTPLTA